MNRPDVKLKQYENTVIDFLRKENGHIACASMDNTFLSVLRNTVNKQLAVTDDCVSSILDDAQIIKTIRDLSVKHKIILLFIERVFNDKETSYLIKQVKNAFANVKVIILTGETDRQRLVLLHEIGADNFISKPISINTLIEKIAFTIKPQGKIGKLIDSGKLCNSQGNFEQALKVARQILEMKPNSAAGNLVLGDAYRGMKKYDKAVEAYLGACDDAPMYLEPLKKLAELYGEKGEQEEQLRYLEKLDRLSPLNVERKVDMGGIHVDLGNEDRAEALFDSALKQAKKEAMTFIEEVTTKIAGIYTTKDPAKAETYYRKALEAKGNMLGKSDIKTFNQLGIALRKQGKWQEAVKEYQKAFKIAPSDENLMYNTAMAFAEGKDFKRACRYLDDCLTQAPDFYNRDSVIAYNIGLIYLKGKQLDKCRKALQASMDQDPNFESPRKLMESITGK